MSVAIVTVLACVQDSVSAYAVVFWKLITILLSSLLWFYVVDLSVLFSLCMCVSVHLPIWGTLQVSFWLSLMRCLFTVLRPFCLFARGQFCPTPLAQIIMFANEGAHSHSTLQMPFWWEALGDSRCSVGLPGTKIKDQEVMVPRPLLCLVTDFLVVAFQWFVW